MSSWVHVNGVMRIDEIRTGDNYTPLDFDKLIGKECLFDSDQDTWDDLEADPSAYLPVGSEGTLQKAVWTDPDSSHMAAHTVAIFGDLRDCYQEDAEKIIEWFKNKCKDLWIRSAVITAEVEGCEPLVYVYR